MLFVMHAGIGLALATGCSQGFEWTVHEKTFLAADAGMVRELRQVAICSTETAGATWSIRLLEPCDAREVDVSISTLGARYATNVEYFLDPLVSPDPRVSGNWFDADLKANGVQHDTVPFYVRGGIGGSFSSTLNWMKEVYDA